jgi:hypothetical protein
MTRVQRGSSANQPAPALKKEANSVTKLGSREVFGPLTHYNDTQIKASQKFKKHKFEQKDQADKKIVSACKRAKLR